jgi:hypothetical protein
LDTINSFVAADDTISFDTTGDADTTNDAAVSDAGALTDGVADGALATDIGNDANIGDALTEFLGTADFDDDDVGGFVFDGDSYIVHADADGAAGNVVELAGVSIATITENTNTDTFDVTFA